jgi:hypothetical protein
VRIVTRFAPQYGLRVGEVRVFYDVSGATVEILAIVAKSEAEGWLRRFGIAVRTAPYLPAPTKVDEIDILLVGGGRPQAMQSRATLPSIVIFEGHIALEKIVILIRKQIVLLRTIRHIVPRKKGANGRWHR